MSEPIPDRQVIERLGRMPLRHALRWCDPDAGGGCGCMGCANYSGGLAKEGVTHEQWKRCVEQLLLDAKKGKGWDD